jgi:hypothetical protein
VKKAGRVADEVVDLSKGFGRVAEETADIVKVAHSSVPDFGKYATAIDDKVRVVEKVALPEWMEETFLDGKYRTVVTTEDVYVYRSFGGRAKVDGSFTTTTKAANRIQTKMDLALLPEWKNTREFEALIKVPKGETLQIGKVGPQVIKKTGTTLQGGIDQIVLPKDFPKERIQTIRVVPSR